MASWKSARNSALGFPAVLAAQVDTTKRVPLGTIIKMQDETQGEGEFIYLPGAASVVEGCAVIFDPTPGAEVVAILDSDLHLNKGWPVAVAAIAIPALSFGWYQIGGIAKTVAVAGCAAGRAFADPTNLTGAIDDTAIAGCQILNARLLTAVGVPAANFAYTYLNRPFIQGQIT